MGKGTAERQIKCVRKEEELRCKRSVSFPVNLSVLVMNKASCTRTVVLMTRQSFVTRTYLTYLITSVIGIQVQPHGTTALLCQT
jgi:hypothetical protein